MLNHSMTICVIFGSSLQYYKQLLQVTSWSVLAVTVLADTRNHSNTLPEIVLEAVIHHKLSIQVTRVLCPIWFAFKALASEAITSIVTQALNARINEQGRRSLYMENPLVGCLFCNSASVQMLQGWLAWSWLHQ